MSYRVFFRCVAEGLAQHGIHRLLRAGGLGEVLVEVSASAFECWSGRSRDQQMRAHVQEAIDAPLAEVRETAAAVVDEVRRYVPGALADLQRPVIAEALRKYLVQVPMSIRQSLRRSGDPSGRTLPTGMAMRSSDQLFAMLPPRLATFEPGTSPVGDWVLTELISTGPLGETWKGERPGVPNAAPAALRFCLDAEAAARMRQDVAWFGQVKQLAAFNSIVPLRQFHAGEPCCLESEYVEGGDLTGLINDWKTELPLQERVSWATKIVVRLAQILGTIHRVTPPVVHRNLKPSNVLVQKGRKGIVLRVADLGIGPRAAEWWLTRSRQGAITRGELVKAQLRGSYTPTYVSPQQRVGEAPDPRDDVFALGMIWYQLVVGDPTGMLGKDFKSQLATQGLKTRVIELLTACMVTDLDRRPRDAQDLVEQLEGVRSASRESSAGLSGVTKAGLSGLSNAGMGSMVLPDDRGIAERPPLGMPQDVKLRKITLADGVDLLVARVNPGTFLMGTPRHEPGSRDHERPEHRVTIREGFYLGIYQVTQLQWRSVMGTDPSQFPGDDRPVEKVSWTECMEFCKRVRERTGKKVRLPTEAEWEFACRAGTTGPFSFGKTISSDQANYCGEEPYGDGEAGEYREQTTPVGSFPPNAWGLFDMHGNVYEWCADWYDGRYYARSEGEDPQGPQLGDHRIIRGGAWCETPALCRSGSRDKCLPGYRVALIGFRVVVTK